MKPGLYVVKQSRGCVAFDALPVAYFKIFESTVDRPEAYEYAGILELDVPVLVIGTDLYDTRFCRAFIKGTVYAFVNSSLEEVVL